MKSFLEEVCGSGVPQRRIGSGCGSRIVGDSVGSFFGRSPQVGRVMDNVSRGRCGDLELREVACYLTGMDRGCRRDYLTRACPGVRRRLLDEGKRLRALVSDSCVSYRPDICHALCGVIDRDDSRSYEYLRSMYDELPVEVRRLLDCFDEDRHSSESMDAVRGLGAYRFVEDGDSRLGSYLRGGVSQESRLDSLVEGSVSAVETLSDEAQEVIEDLGVQAESMAESFLDTLSSMYAENVSRVVREEVLAQTDALLREELGSDVSVASEESLPAVGVSEFSKESLTTEGDSVEAQDAESAEVGVSDSYADRVSTGRRVRRVVGDSGSGLRGVSLWQDWVSRSESVVPEYVVHGTIDPGDDVDWERTSEAVDWDMVDLARYRQRIEYLGQVDPESDHSYGVRYYSPNGRYSDVMFLGQEDYVRNLSRDRSLYGDDGRGGLGLDGRRVFDGMLPAAPEGVGVPVRLSYCGNLYDGVVESVGSGSVVISGLPFEYFSARHAEGLFTGTSDDFTFPYGDTVILYDLSGLVSESGDVSDISGDASNISVDDVIVSNTGSAVSVDGDSISNTDGFLSSDGGLVSGDVVGDSSDSQKVFVHPDRAAVLADWGGVSTDSLEEVDDYSYRMGDKVYSVFEGDELAERGLFRSDATDEHTNLFIFDKQSIAPHPAYRTGKGSIGLDEIDFSEAELLVPLRRDLEGLDKLISQLDNIMPAEARPRYNWGIYEIILEIPARRGSTYDEPYSALMLQSSSGDALLMLPLGDSEDAARFKDLYQMIEGATDREMDMMFDKDSEDLRKLAREIVDLAIRFKNVPEEQIPALRMSLRNVITDSADSEDLVSVALSRVRSGEDLVSEDSSLAILSDISDEDEFIIFMAGDSTDVVPVSEAESWLRSHMDCFASLLGVQDSDSSDVVVDVVEVSSSDVLPLVSEAVGSWCKAWSFSLSQDNSDENLDRAAGDLVSRLSGILKDVRLEPSIRRVLYRDQRFIDVKPDGLYVGTTLFVYQTGDRSIDVLASSASDVAVQMVSKIGVDGLVEGVEVVSDAFGSNGILSEDTKEDVIASVERDIVETLEKKGLVIEDSVSIDIDSVHDSAPNTFDIPHTASTFHKVRDTRRVMDSVLVVASERLGERITGSMYRSMCGSSSKKAMAKVSCVLDSAVMLNELDLVCPALYKRRMTDSVWVCDDVYKVVDSFGLDASLFHDGGCVLSSESLGSTCHSFKVGSRELFILQD